MSGDLVRKVVEASREKETRTRETLKRNQHAFAHAVSMFQGAPGLRGFWPMSGFDSTGDATDFGGLVHPMQYTGNPTYGYTGVMPYIDLDGTGDYLTVADHADFDILGTETYVASAFRGLTMVGWFNLDAVAASQALIAKSDSVAANSSYHLYMRNTTPSLRFQVSNGAAFSTVDMTVVTPATTFLFCAARYTPSTEIKVWQNLDTATNTTAIPAAIANSARALTIGAFDGGASLLAGTASFVAVYAMALSDAIITTLYQQTRRGFGV